ncbi:SDR family oxidoreductase [Glacieibacterium frigidum]|uniref:Sugar nucleotide-binding protein n=1 Tax=Glacieibacterium frigidum TaxID=2593303 RepID=A0A552UF96_9SPHN|nr:SDR family oxidoreductase [Glacieibacterium frigidum]TRW16898.1 sugar nucleotide-binding protein [Glacieibacterium frigidum]
MHILVTGAAGLVGADLCVRLRERGHQVTGLVHRRGADGETVAGDVAVKGLGIDLRPDLVVHCAAITAFDATPEAYARVNVGGAANVVAFAEKIGARLLHVSTAYVCGTRDGRISEGEVGEAFVNGYEASKASAEALVRASSAPWTIARPSVVVGDSMTGAIASFENIYLIFRLIAEGRVRTLPASARATLDLVPIDHVGRGLVALAETPAPGVTVHLTAATPTRVHDLGAAIAAVPGLGHPEFVDPLAFDVAALPPAERRWHAAAAALYTNYLTRAPVFDQANASRLVPPCPPTDRAWLDRLIAYCLERGFVTARPDNARPAASGGY